jgi:hypothetical protein
MQRYQGLYSLKRTSILTKKVFILLVAPAKSLYKHVDAQFMIYFNCYTRVQLAKDPPTTFPKYIYRITPFSSLESYAKNNTNFLGKHNIVISFILHILPIIIPSQYLLISLPHQMSWVLLLIYLKSNKSMFLDSCSQL